MVSWKAFIVGSVLLALVIVGGIFLSRSNRPLDAEARKTKQDSRLLVLSLWLALLSILAYIVFVFGKR
jgi:glucose uptake protein GlcU